MWKLERPDKHGELMVECRGSLQDCLSELFYLIDHPPTPHTGPLVLSYTRDDGAGMPETPALSE